MTKAEVPGYRAYRGNELELEQTYQDQLTDLRSMSDLFDQVFFRNSYPPGVSPLRTKISPADLTVRTWSAHQFEPSEGGEVFNIAFNVKYLTRKKWDLYESLLHEKVHAFQYAMARAGIQDYKAGIKDSHNRAFTDKAEEIGLHVRAHGGNHWKPADGRFAALMVSMGIEKPTTIEDFDEMSSKDWRFVREERQKGSSTLIKYFPDKPELCKNFTATGNYCNYRSGLSNMNWPCPHCEAVMKPQV